MQRNAKKCWEMQRNVVRHMGIILAKIRALDGRNYGRNSNFIFKFNFLKKSKLAIYGHLAIGPCATNSSKWGIPEKNYKNIAQRQQ